MTAYGPDFIALQVVDLERSARFYEARLGLRRTASSPPHAVVFDTSPITFAVREPLPGLDLSATDPWPGAGVVLWLQVDDARVMHADLADNGVPIVAPLNTSPFGLMFSFRDPDGYSVTLHERP